MRVLFVVALLASCASAHREVGVDAELRCDAACELKLKVKREATVEQLIESPR